MAVYLSRTNCFLAQNYKCVRFKGIRLMSFFTAMKIKYIEYLFAKLLEHVLGKLSACLKLQLFMKYLTTK